MLYCFINNAHVDYAKLLWEGDILFILTPNCTNSLSQSSTLGRTRKIESTQETYRTLSAPMIPNLDTIEGESSAPRKPTEIRFRVRTQPDLETPIPTSAEIDIDSLDEAT
ncbi:hypothetical protein Tco_0810103 [Tanacetum coccineum]